MHIDNKSITVHPSRATNQVARNLTDDRGKTEMTALTDIVRANDHEALAAYVEQRFEVAVADSHKEDLMRMVARGFSAVHHGCAWVEARLKHVLHKEEYFERIIGEAELFDPHCVWNALHWPWEPGFADKQHGPRYEHKPEYDGEPQYTRSRLPKTSAYIAPINSVALKVARPPDEQRKPDTERTVTDATEREGKCRK